VVRSLPLWQGPVWCRMATAQVCQSPRHTGKSWASGTGVTRAILGRSAGTAPSPVAARIVGYAALPGTAPVGMA